MDISDSANCNLASSMSLQLSQNTPIGQNSAANGYPHNNNNSNDFISANNNNKNVSDVTPSVDSQLFLNNQQGQNWIEELIGSAQRKPHDGIKPMRQRNLPASFFTPPDPSLSNSASHSRESSIDQTSPHHQTPASPLSPASCITGNQFPLSLR